MDEITPAEQEELDALLRKERQAMVSRVANPQSITDEERMQVLREIRGGGGPMSSSAEIAAAKASTVIPSTIAAIATGGASPLVQAGVGALTALGSSGLRQSIERTYEGKPFRPLEMVGEAVSSAVPTLKGVPLAKYIPFLKSAEPTSTAYRAANLALNTALSGTGAAAGGVVSGNVTDLPSAAREAAFPMLLTAGPQALGEAAGEASKLFSKWGAKAETVEKAGIQPLFTDVFPEAAAFAQRAQSKLSSGTLHKLEENQLRQIEQAAQQLGGVQGVGQPGNVKRVYQDAVALLGLGKVEDITRNSKDFTSATQALNTAVEEAKTYAKQLQSAEQEAYKANSAIRIADAENAYNDFVEGLGVRTEREIQSKLGPRIASAETRATESVFPSGVPYAGDVSSRGFQIQDLITQPAEGRPPGLKQVTDSFFEKQYKSIPTTERLFSPYVPIGETGISLIDKVKDLKSSIPKTGQMPGLEDIIKGATRTEKVPIAGTGGMASRNVISNFSLGELREIRSNLENWAYSTEAYSGQAKAKAKELSNYITTMINEQAPQVFKPEIAQQLLDTNKKYAQVRQLWENPLVESAFAGVKATPEKMLEKIGSSVVKYGASSSDYRGITDLMDNLKAVGVEGVPDRSEINAMVQQYIAAQSLGKNGQIDNQKLLGILNGIERTSPRSLAKLGFGNVAELENFDVVKNLIKQSTNAAGDVDYRGLLTKLSVIGSEDPSKLKALGLGTIQDIDSLNRIVTNLGDKASTAAKAKELAKSDTLAGYQVSERILGLMDDSKDIRSVMNVLQDQVVSGSTPELRKQAAKALVNTRASAVEDLLFGRTSEGVSQGARSLDVQKIKDALKDESSRERYADIFGPNLLSKIENDLIPGLEIIAERQKMAGGAGQTTGGTLIERGAMAGLKGPLALGGIAGAAALGTTKSIGQGALAAAVVTAMDIGGTALASKVLARTVGATGLKSKAAATAGLQTLIDRVNRAPNREAALELMSIWSEMGTLPDQSPE